MYIQQKNSHERRQAISSIIGNFVDNLVSLGWIYYRNVGKRLESIMVCFTQDFLIYKRRGCIFMHPLLITIVRLFLAKPQALVPFLGIFCIK